MKTMVSKTHPSSHAASSSARIPRAIEVKPPTPNTANPAPAPAVNSQTIHQVPSTIEPSKSPEEEKDEYEKSKIVRLVKWKPDGK
jgi:hypothetical protein